jgi:cell wall-associated NlpC family hydrolase
VAARPLHEPAPAPALESSPLPDPQSAAGTHHADLPTGVVETYGAGPATDATAPYATALSADLTAYYASGPPADVTTATYGAGLPSVPASALAAPVPAVSAELTTAPAPAVGHSTQTERVVAFARAQIGRPCVWGAAGPGSYDAPGLTQAAWKAAGVTLPRTTQAQWGAGVQVTLADVQVGDLVFFHDDLGHVGIWSGDGMMIHAPGPGAFIREESVFFAGQSAIKGAVRPA